MLRPPYYYYHYAYDHRQRPAGRRVSRYDVVAHVQRPRWFVLLLVVFTELRDMLPAMSGAPRCRVAPGAAAPAGSGAQAPCATTKLLHFPRPTASRGSLLPAASVVCPRAWR